MKRRTLEVDHWRHFMPLAPDIEIQVESGAVSSYVFANDVIIQGARDPDTHESPSVNLKEIPFQRGWRLTVVPITHPLQGQVKSTVDGFEYEVHRQFNGVDCFNYLLTNGTQESNIATVKLNVVQGYQYDIALRHKYNDTFELEMVGLLPTELQLPQWELFNWYITIPTLKRNPELGNRMQVEFIKRRLASYSLGGYVDSHNRYQYTVRSNPVKLQASFPDDTVCDGYPIGSTDVLYEANGDRGQLEVEVVFYYGELVRSESKRFTTTPEMIYGRRWWESGNREGQVPPKPDVSVASSVNLQSTSAINDLLSLVESNVEGSVPNNATRHLIKDASLALGVTTGAEMLDVLNSATLNGGDFPALLNKMLESNAIEALSSIQTLGDE